MIERTDDGDEYVERLAGHDEAVALGRSGRGDAAEVRDDPEIQERLDRIKPCLQLLERVWPRADNTCVRSAATHDASVSGGLAGASRKVAFGLDGGLTMAAMCPELESTNRMLLLPSSWVAR